MRRLRGWQNNLVNDTRGSPIRDKKAWVTAVLFPALLVVVTTVLPGGWSWVLGLFSGPPEVKLYSDGPMGCVPRYSAASLDELKAKPDMLRREGVPVADSKAGDVSVHVTLQTKSSQSIVVTGVRVDVLATDPLPGTGQVIDASGCGGGMDPRPFDVDFSAHPVSVKPGVVRMPGGVTKPGIGFPFKVSSNDPEQLVLDLRSVQGDVRFSVTVTWVSEGELGSATLDNGGKGYRVMGPGNLPRHPNSMLYPRKAQP
ncbi:hypothetical protein ACODT5_42660 [Streptomyces sp. 5.8]|uniref:hypothetical protein n=1 Tax=Streptomyces sp. 5.8 TaxID=3406571 RepID=UPI003BB6FFFD